MNTWEMVGAVAGAGLGPGQSGAGAQLVRDQHTGAGF